MPIDPDVQKALDGLTAMLSPEALAKALIPALAPAMKAHTDAAMKGVVTTEGLEKFGTDLAAKLKPAEPENKGDGKDKDKPNEAMAALQKKVDETNARLEAAERARVEAVRKANIDANRGKVKDALTAAGIDAAAMHIVMPALEASGQLVLDGDGIGWKGKDSYGVDAILPFDAGAKAWAGTPDGKRFIPPTGAGGTGDKLPNNGGGHTGPSAIRNGDGSLNLGALASKVMAAS